MPYFSPPVRVRNSAVVGWRDMFSQSPMKFFSANGRVPKGVNVYVTTGGVVTETFPRWENVATVYYGGHVTEVDAAEAAVLTAAGYTVTSSPPS